MSTKNHTKSKKQHGSFYTAVLWFLRNADIRTATLREVTV